MPFREQQSDLWSGIKTGNAVCITTNGDITKDGRAVMGRGTALQARERFPGVDAMFGEQLKQYGNHCHAVGLGELRGPGKQFHDWYLVAFPTKHHWRDRTSNLDLIARSAEELVFLTDLHYLKEVYLPRPGTLNGKLDWLQVVTSGALDCLDERFIVVYQ